MGKEDGLKKWQVAVIVASITALITALTVGGLAGVLAWYFTDQAASCTPVNTTRTYSSFNTTSVLYQQIMSDDDSMTVEITNETMGAPYLGTEYPPSLSCKTIKASHPDAISGYYNLITVDGTIVRTIYCVMTDLCGIGGGGWTRIALEVGGSCSSSGYFHRRIATSQGSCTQLTFPTYGIYYSEVCGIVEGFEIGQPDADDTTARNDITSYFIDGIAILRDNFEKNNHSDTHLWSFMADDGDHHCPCSKNKNQPPVAFIGNHYYCEAGTTHSEPGVIYSDDPLWDGQGCDDSETPCCSLSPIMPWFYRGGLLSGDPDVLFRICADQGTDDEDILFGKYEFYIR